MVGGDIHSDFGHQRSPDGTTRPSRRSSIGPCEPKPDSDSYYFGRFCEGAVLRISTTFHSTGPTFDGPNGGTSRADHIAAPTEANMLVKKCVPSALLPSLPHKKIPKTPAFGHRYNIPIALEFKAIRRNHALPGGRGRNPGIDRDQFMQCLQKGARRQELFERIDVALRDDGEERWQEAMGESSPDKAWDMLGGSARKALKTACGCAA